MAKVIPFGQPENESERLAIVYLREHLPDENYTLYTNLEIMQGDEPYEVDIILLTPHCVYAIDVKGVHGTVNIDRDKWYPGRSQYYPSPLKKLRKHSKVLKSAILDINRALRAQLDKVWVGEAVLLTADNADIIPRPGHERELEKVVYLDKKGINFFRDHTRIPSRFTSDIRRYISIVDKAIQGRSQANRVPKFYRDWEIEESLGSTDRYAEYRAKKTTFGVSGLKSRLRVYKVDLFLEPEERQRTFQIISTAFIAVHQIPPHPNILGFQESPFESSDSEGLVIVYEDIPGQALSQCIKQADLNPEERLNIMRDVLHGLEHAHKHGVIHRNITPDTVFVTTERQAKLTSFDYARITNRTSTIAPDIAEELEEFSAYQALECHQDPSQASIQSDLFSAGLVFYELLTGQVAFQDVHDLYERESQLPQSVAELNPDLNPGFDQWLQKLCAFDAKSRFQNADEALRALTPLISLPKPDLRDLPAETVLDNRFRVVQRLGKPGSFAVAYKVFDTFGKSHCVIKLVTRDRRSLFERVQQEYALLRKIPKHPHIVDVIWADRLTDFDDTPFIVFEYLDGQDLEHVLQEQRLTTDEVLEFAQQILLGILHLHQHGFYHQDIKPSNLLLTVEGIKIIDFNVAVAEADEAAITAGTRRYLPPDLRPTSTPSTEQRVDRDLYALGITLYEFITGEYPFGGAQPQLGERCHDPRVFEGCESLSEGLVDFLKKAIAPKRSDRFSSATEFLEALNYIISPQESISEDVEVDTIEVTSEERTVLPEELIEPEPEDIPVQLVDEQPIVNTAPIETVPIQPDELPLVAPIARPKPAVAAEPEKSFPDIAFNLFELPASEQQASPNAEKPIVLDPSKAYPPDTGRYTVIDTEADWMRHFGISNTPYWVRGKALCNWAEEWLRGWNRTHQIAEIKRLPHERLAELLGPVNIPTDWTKEQCLAVVMHLERYETNSVANLLAELTKSDPSIWKDAPSIENLAEWLAIEVPQEACALEKAWQAQCPKSALTSYYQTTDKQQLLKQWLGIADSKLSELGSYPFLDVPLSLKAEFEAFWERELYRTHGRILDNLNFNTQPASKRVAETAYKVLQQHPDFITSERQKHLKGYIAYPQYEELTQYQRPPEPQPLCLDASTSDALQWVTDQYLPLRRWETKSTNLPLEKKVCDRLAASFEEWILKHYPNLIVDAVSSSWLNYNVSHHVQELCSQGPVLWVVVDGLGWLDHQVLLDLLTEQKQLQLERNLEPRFSILPTKTEYAKWSLYSQRRPGHSSWKPSAGEGFIANDLLTQNGKRYTDHDVKQQRLKEDLLSGNRQLYCWDTDRFDKLFHDEVDWEELYKVQRPRELRTITEDILRFVDLHPQRETLRVVVASDHGQLMGRSNKLPSLSEDLEMKGRMAIGKADYPQLVVLDKERFDLPHDISVIRGSDSFSSFSYADDKSIVGCHGGLYPEEVVIGFSVLTRLVKRLPVIVKCSGSGRPSEAGILKVEIDNPNSVAIADLKLVVNQIKGLQQGTELIGTVSPKETQTFDIETPNWPELPPTHDGNALLLKGKLEFQYQNAEMGTAELDQDSVIEVKQIFSSGLESGLDDFFE
ncbi:protein kinase [Oscillatoria sp. CS-180]|uniref:methylation-associated defense system protein kinase MAD6 n=1 Tax=Oscillatoria sp. CS-180 TaxID=3021720 RepID=UPI00232E8A84|nr:protein kinase [Oscillatoria sp. CS-180]MDB9527850.1 protein kinase [Oscillatoria sp. CS-180]